MNVSLDQAIQIHARALKGRTGKKSPLLAKMHAEALREKGDMEGFRVWTLVGEQAALLVAAQAASDEETAEKIAVQ
jgi:hypothetical protein